MNITGFGIGNYKSFGKVECVSPIKKLNIFIGRNNSGKSNVLSYIKNVFPVLRNKQELSRVLNESRHIGKDSQNFELFLSFDIDAYIDNHFGSLDISANTCAKIIVRNVICEDINGISYIKYRFMDGEFTFDQEVSKRAEESSKEYENYWHKAWLDLTGRNGGSLNGNWIPETLRVLDPLLNNHLQFPQDVHLIPAIRRIGEPNTDFNGYDGGGLIKRIAELQNPGLTDQAKKKQFDSIVNFLRTVTKNETATIEIPYGRDMIIVHMDGKTLPLEALGTGIHQVIILAAAATSIDSQIVCLEEPEIYLHPRLQRELMKYLMHETTNTYFVTTHSVHVMDTPGSSIFHVSNDGDSTSVQLISDDMLKSRACFDVGAKASDIAQANSIIWVEGPSDKIYIEHLLGIAEPEFVEGIDFTIMFYGGRLLSHLTLDDELEGFIRLLRINRNSSVIIDSDRTKSKADVNPTKNRIKRELEKISGYCWITKPREIENCTPKDVFLDSIKKIYGDSCTFPELDDFSDWLDINKADKPVKVDKVRLAREIIQNWKSLEQGKVKKEILCLCDFIKHANQ